MQTTDAQRKWDSLADTWDDAGPPSTPSDEDIGHYGHLLRSVTTTCSRAPSILLLGCTPKLRKMLAEFHCAFTCVDVSAKMYDRTTQYLKSTVPTETFLQANWCQMDFAPVMFDVAIGDKVLDNVPPEFWNLFKGSLQRALKPMASFITRLAPQDPSLVGLTFKQLLIHWALRYSKTEMPLDHAAAALWEQALGASVATLEHVSTQTVSKFDPEIAALKASATLTLPERQLLNEFQRLYWRSKDECWSSYSMGQVIKFFGSFRLEAERTSNDYHCAHRQPIVKLTKIV